MKKPRIDRKKLNALAAKLNSLRPQVRGRIFREVSVAAPKYLSIMRFNENVATDRNFQRTFNSLYRVRRSRSTWQPVFYSLFARVRRSPSRHSQLRDILCELRYRTGQWEYSFATKLLHTVDPTQPIMDSNVLPLLGLTLGGKRDADRLVAHYAQLAAAITYLRPRLSKLLASFDRKVPKLRRISVVKKIDFILWR